MFLSFKQRLGSTLAVFLLVPYTIAPGCMMCRCKTGASCWTSPCHDLWRPEDMDLEGGKTLGSTKKAWMYGWMLTGKFFLSLNAHGLHVPAYIDLRS